MKVKVLLNLQKKVQLKSKFFGSPAYRSPKVPFKLVDKVNILDPFEVVWTYIGPLLSMGVLFQELPWIWKTTNVQICHFPRVSTLQNQPQLSSGRIQRYSEVCRGHTRPSAGFRMKPEVENRWLQVFCKNWSLPLNWSVTFYRPRMPPELTFSLPWRVQAGSPQGVGGGVQQPWMLKSMVVKSTDIKGLLYLWIR